MTAARTGTPGEAARPAVPVFRGNIAVLAVTAAANVAGQMVWYPILPLVLRDLGASDFEVSLAYGVMVVVGALGQMPGGLFADRWGRKPAVVLPTFVVAAALFGAVFAPSWVWLALAAAVQSACTAFQTAGFITLNAESVPPGKAGEAFAYFELFASLGMGLGPALGAALLPWLPVRGLFAVSAGIFLVSAVIRQVALDETHRPARSARARPGRTGPDLAGRAGPDLAGPDCAKPRVVRRFGPADLFRGELVWLTLTAVGLLTATNLTVSGPFIPLYAHDAIGLAKQKVDLLFVIGPLVAAASGLAMGRLVARRGGGAAVAWGLGGVGVACAGVLLASTFGWALVTVSAAAVGLQLAWVGYDTLRAEVATPEERGRAVGLLGALGSAAGAVLLPVMGRLAESVGAGPAIAIGVVFCAAGAAAAVGASRWERGKWR